MLLFNAMITHGYTPNAFLLLTIIHIVKNNHGNTSCIDNYRVITLSNTLGKLLVSFHIHSKHWLHVSKSVSNKNCIQSILLYYKKYCITIIIEILCLCALPWCFRSIWSLIPCKKLQLLLKWNVHPLVIHLILYELSSQ